MSYTGKVKEELAGLIPGTAHCQIAELAAILEVCGRICIDVKDRKRLIISTENLYAARAAGALLGRSCGYRPEVLARTGRSRIYYLVLTDPEMTERILKNARLPDGQVDAILMRDCCRKAYLRGAFLAAGFIGDPNGGYHLEIPCCEKAAERLKEILELGEVPVRVTNRRKGRLIYVKDGSGVVDTLGLMGAARALMELENIRIVKEMRGSVNRQVNCETSNIRKTVSASARQLEDIELIERTIGLAELPDTLRETAVLRKSFPEATLPELAEMCNPPVGKSGMNHRLRRISETAARLRAQHADPDKEGTT